MTPEQNKTFEELFELFNTNGWKTIHQALTDRLEQFKVSSFTECAKSDQWHFRRGQVDMLVYVLNLPEITQKLYEAELEEEGEDESSE